MKCFTVIYTDNNKKTPLFPRIPKNHSLFERPPEPLLQDAPMSTEYCKCEFLALDELVPCGKLTDAQTYPELTRHDVVVPTGNIVNSFIRGRRRRDVDSGFTNNDYDPKDFDHAPDSKNNLDFSWPTATGITQEEAEDYCNKGIMGSQVYLSCKDHVGTVDIPLAKCIADVKVLEIIVLEDYNNFHKFLLQTSKHNMMLLSMNWIPHKHL